MVQHAFQYVFHAILRPILKYRFCAIFSRELSVFAIFYSFYNYERNGYLTAKSIRERIRTSGFPKNIEIAGTSTLTTL